MADWERHPPRLYDIVTGFFPETSPKSTWETNPRPLLVCGTARDPERELYFCRVAYGTTKVSKVRQGDLSIGNMSLLDELCLKRPTRFVINSGRQLAILPWTEEFFRPWTRQDTPILSRLPEDMQRHVGAVLGKLDDLPSF